jgi:hypothetical protein
MKRTIDKSRESQFGRYKETATRKVSMKKQQKSKAEVRAEAEARIEAQTKLGPGGISPVEEKVERLTAFPHSEKGVVSGAVEEPAKPKAAKAKPAKKAKEPKGPSRAASCKGRAEYLWDSFKAKLDPAVVRDEILRQWPGCWGHGELGIKGVEARFAAYANAEAKEAKEQAAKGKAAKAKGEKAEAKKAAKTAKTPKAAKPALVEA